MCVGARMLVMAWAIALSSAAVDKKFNITVGYLPTLTGEMRDYQGPIISGAIALALEELNNSTDILPDVKVLLEWHDTNSDSMRTTKLLNDCKGVVAFFGPEGSSYTDANFANSRNLPMFSYKSADYRASLLSNFVRIDPPRVQAMKSVISLLRYYRWYKFSILYEMSWVTEVQALEAQAKKNNMTINHQLRVEDTSDSRTSDFNWLIQNTKNKTRIYVFLGSTSGLLNMMTAMDSQHLFAEGDSMVIYVDMMPYRPQNGLQYITRPDDLQHSCPNITNDFTKRARSLLVVTASQPSSSFENFADLVEKNNKGQHFNFQNIFGIKNTVSIYAAYLYDSVKLYATALDELIKEDTHEEKLTYGKLMSIANNGSRIVARIIKNSPYTSVSGLPIQLDEHATAQGNFCLLAFKATRSLGDINCSHTMMPVGQFENNNREYTHYRINARLWIDWANNIKPEDEPPCGFLKEKCVDNRPHGFLYNLRRWL